MALCAATALGLCPTAAAFAQTSNETYVGGPEVVVLPSPRAERDPASGAPIELVSESVTVRYADLDLGTGAGADALRDRIVQAAFAACWDLSRRFVVVQDNNRQCVIDAVRAAIYQTPLGRAPQPVQQ